VIDPLRQFISFTTGRSVSRRALIEALDPLCPGDRHIDKCLNDLSEMDGVEQAGIENSLKDDLIALDVER
jgi:hypothetical protein